MTIIKPAANESYAKFLLLVFGIVLLGSLVYIFEYNSLADARFELGNLKESIVKAEAANADLKNALYKVVDPVLLEKRAASENMILDRNPQYLKSNKWLSDSSL
ncbi:MAG TPA: hypothetical protein VNK70_02715 [Candidatus Paceibacterota bacterium]|nr:hypothetical protein [Candidatus Paceibacterota bacterium]